MASTTAIFKHNGINYRDYEPVVLQLVSEFKNAAVFPDALTLLEENYSEYSASIFAATKEADLGPYYEGEGEGQGVRTYEEALNLMLTNNFVVGMTDYRQIGLVTAINAQYYNSNRVIKVSKGANYNATDEEQQSQFSFDANIEAAPSNSSSDVAYLIGSRYDLALAGRGEKLNLSLYSIPVLEYLRRKYLQQKFSGNSIESELYITIVEEIYNLLGEYVLPSDVPRSGETGRGIEQARRAIERYNKGLELIESTKNASADDLGNLLNKSLVSELTNTTIVVDDDFKATFNVNVNSFSNPNYDVKVKILQLFDVLESKITDEFGPLPNSGRYGGSREQRIERELGYILDWFGATPARDVPEDSPLQDLEVSSIADSDVKNEDPSPLPRLRPYDLQCFLYENIGKITNKRSNGGSYTPEYRNVIRLDSNGNPGTVLNRIEASSNYPEIKSLLDICPDVYSLLTPYLKISRVEYDNKGKILLENNKPVVKELEIPNFLTQNQIANILGSTAGRVPGAGIKSFSWSLDGVQPAEVDNNITAELVLYFQSVNDFFNGSIAAGQEKPNFLDLIINSPALRKSRKSSETEKKPEDKTCKEDIKKDLLHTEYDGKGFRVQITAGWSTPPIEALVSLVGAQKANLLEAAISKSKITLYLQMVQHQINFNQNGSLELTVNYRASLAGLLSGRTANIFDESSKLIEDDIEKAQEEIEEVESNKRMLSSDKKRRLEELTKEIKELRNIDRNVKYKKLLQGLFEENNTKIYNLEINPLELALPPYESLTPKQRSARVKRRLSQSLDIRTYEQSVAYQSTLLETVNKNKAGNGEDTSETHTNTEIDRFEELQKKNIINIPFIFLGDLIDNVLEQIKKNYPDDLGTDGLDFKFFMSDVEMIDPLQAFKVENLENLIDCGYNLRDIKNIERFSTENPQAMTNLSGIFRTMNIGDIPISLDTFQLWFKNNVIKSERINYFLLYFIKDICKDLISTALSSECFGKEFKFEQRFDSRPLTFTKQKGKSRFIPGTTAYSVKDLAAAKQSEFESVNPTNVETGLILYSTDSKPKALNPKTPVMDIVNGVYHHYLGSSCGLVKQINFQREDQPYLRESRIQKQGALGAEQLRELYSANIDLVGNVLYKNGMFIYINPSLLNADQAYLDYLGLHGYYLVTKVESKVTPSSFDVSIRALHQATKFDSQELQPTSIIVNEPDSPEVAPRNALKVQENIQRERNRQTARETEENFRSGGRGITVR